MLAFLLTATPAPFRKTLTLGDAAEKELVMGLLAGNTSSLDKLYDSYSAALLGIISKIVKHDDVAEDVLQETFLKIWTSIPQYDPARGRLFTWMARLAKNKSIDHLRSRAEINSQRNEDIDLLSPEVNQLHQIQYNPEHIGLKQLMSVLAPAQLLVLDLVYFQGYTQSEAALELNIPVGTVKTRIRIAIKTLRTFF
jgi:RNA polymerase sigma factor (sigma-70 family)